MHESMESRFEAVEEQFREFGQEHVLRFWDRLDTPGREGLLAQAERLGAGLGRWTEAWRSSHERAAGTPAGIEPLEGAKAKIRLLRLLWWPPSGSRLPFCRFLPCRTICIAGQSPVPLLRWRCCKISAWIRGVCRPGCPPSAEPVAGTESADECRVIFQLADVFFTFG